jgi:hypothetical protein
VLVLNFDTSLPKQTQVFSLDGRQYKIRAIWRERARGWYFHVSLPDGTGVSDGARVAAGGLVVPDLNRWDDEAVAGGVLFAYGKDEYAREDLGQPGGINVAYLTRSEWDTVLAEAANLYSLLVTDS